MTTLLNLQKNDILDLSKKDPSLKNILLGGGWDVAKKGFFGFGADYDLDLIALLLGEDGKLIKSSKSVIYYNDMVGQGIKLHGDNRTGEGEGDDEKISISLDKLPIECKKVVFAVTIYDAVRRRAEVLYSIREGRVIAKTLPSKSFINLEEEKEITFKR